jgi:tRNA dimethylallyltransferase
MPASIEKTAIVIVGPTASGKTLYSLSLAKKYSTSIVSADSRQCYRELNIGVAKPLPEELSAVRHYFINTHSIDDRVDTVVFEEEALRGASETLINSDHLIVTGGTGLYVKVFCEGIDEIPVADAATRMELMQLWKAEGVEGLQRMLSGVDPEFLQQTNEKNNRARLMRALEVKLASGRSILSFRQGTTRQRPFRIRKIGLNWPREVLYNRINKRVDQMMADGLLEEAKALYPHRHRKALQTVGYQELFDHFDGRYSLDEAVDKIRQHTRNYAKRQLTWFRKDPDIQWQRPEDGFLGA